MQMEAPGTYHHSLVVAQLAENAANAIGANPLLARVCALFHDIGKTNKPEYFTENQRDRTNPHDENNPSLSALIIKSHVKDGVDLAIKHKLPRAVIDVIQQHHGTSLIRFFYQRARGEKRYQAGGSNWPMPAGNSRPPVSATRPPVSTTRPPVSATRPPVSATRPPLSTQNAPGLEPVPVSEMTYRYDGPKPRFKESASILLADGVEAASRSMRKVTPQHLGELIDQIFKDRFEDGQLDEAPLTFEDLSKIKASFTLTLLNMLHARVAYPPQPEKVEESPGEKEKSASPEPAGKPSSEPVK
jgi:putative nucleotidyltransferase with HDIG domain